MGVGEFGLIVDAKELRSCGSTRKRSAEQMKLEAFISLEGLIDDLVGGETFKRTRSFLPPFPSACHSYRNRAYNKGGARQLLGEA